MLGTIISLLLAVYVIACVIFIIMDNRSPKSTLAWVLGVALFPIIGLLVYLFLGRSWRAFSQEEEMAKAVVDDGMKETLAARHMGPVQAHEAIATRKPESYDPAILNLVQNSGLSTITLYNEATILQDANNFYPSLLEDLKKAQHHIHMQYFIWSNDPFTQEVKQVLIERVKAGVKVRALYDGSSRGAMGKQYRQEMEAGGIEFVQYLGYDTLRTLHRANYRCHRKITIIDGKVGYLGGMNLDREQMPGMLWPRWRDTQVRLEGEGAQSLQLLFLANWEYTMKQKVERAGLFPDLPDATNFLPVQIVASGPDSQWKGIRQLYFYMIAAARKTCYIQSPFFIPDESILEAMKSAALAGVDVRMICTPRGAKYQMPYRAALTYFKDVTAAGVKCYLYNGGYYHAKTISIDGRICTIGSCNMDIRSYDLDYEVNSVLYDAALTRQLEAQFLADLQDCTLFSLDEYETLSGGRRFLDSFWRLASPVM
ncbi:MAG: cardiolipin synthase [Caldilineaceae bacterium]